MTLPHWWWIPCGLVGGLGLWAHGWSVGRRGAAPVAPAFTRAVEAVASHEGELRSELSRVSAERDSLRTLASRQSTREEFYPPQPGCPAAPPALKSRETTASTSDTTATKAKDENETKKEDVRWKEKIVTVEKLLPSPRPRWSASIGLASTGSMTTISALMSSPGIAAAAGVRVAGPLWVKALAVRARGETTAAIVAEITW